MLGLDRNGDRIMPVLPPGDNIITGPNRAGPERIDRFQLEPNRVEHMEHQYELDTDCSCWRT